MRLQHAFSTSSTRLQTLRFRRRPCPSSDWLREIHAFAGFLPSLGVFPAWIWLDYLGLPWITSDFLPAALSASAVYNYELWQHSLVFPWTNKMAHLSHFTGTSWPFPPHAEQECPNSFASRSAPTLPFSDLRPSSMRIETVA